MRVVVADDELPMPRPRPAVFTITVAPGDSDSFTVSGNYELVSNDEGDLHLKAIGSGVDSGERFKLGINVHLRG